MLDLNYILNNLELVKDKTRKRQYNFDFENLLQLAEKRKTLIKDVEELKRTRNEGSKKISQLIREGQDVSSLNKEMRDISEQIKTLDNTLKSVNEEINRLLHNIPNIIDDTVPIGDGEADNIIIKTYGEKPYFDFQPKPHWEIAENLGIVDFNRGAKLSNPVFCLLW